MYNTEADTVCERLRFIAFRSPKGTGRAMDYLERQGLRDAERRLRPLIIRRFTCRKDALRTPVAVISAHHGSAYDVIADVIGKETILILYLDQYKVKHMFRLIKSGMSMNSIRPYAHVCSRALLVVAIATRVSSTIDALLRRYRTNPHLR